MKKKTMTIVSGTAGLVLGLSACGTETYEYKVSGLVQEQHLDYEDCPGVNLSMDTVAFASGRSGSTGGSGGRSSSGGSSGSRSSSGGSGSGSSGKSDSGSNSKNSSGKSSALKNKGVKLDKKPEKPEKVKSRIASKPKYKVKPHKDCETEYEIFVLADDGTLYEQDVRKSDYDKCANATVPKGLKSKLFPLCTKG